MLNIVKVTSGVDEDRQMSSLADTFLLDGLRKGDQACFEEIFARYRNGVYGVLFRLLGSREEAEDLTQEVFLRLYRRPLPVGRENNLPGWLYRVAINTGYNAIRSKKRDSGRVDRAISEGSSLVKPENLGEDPPDQLIVAEERGQVRRVLLAMGERARTCLILRNAGLSYAEISAVLGVASSSVGTILARSEREFRDKYLAMFGMSNSQAGEVI